MKKVKKSVVVFRSLPKQLTKVSSDFLVFSPTTGNVYSNRSQSLCVITVVPDGTDLRGQRSKIGETCDRRPGLGGYKVRNDVMHWQRHIVNSHRQLSSQVTSPFFLRLYRGLRTSSPTLFTVTGREEVRFSFYPD